MPEAVTPFGDRAVRFAIEERTSRRRLLASLRSVAGVVDVVLAEEIGCAVLQENADRDAVVRALSNAAQLGEDPPERTHLVRVVYDGEDLDAVARAAGRSREAVVALHSETDYRVAMLGFLPGFAYLRGLSEALRLPRRPPRVRVPAGSVGIAADYTGVYPFVSPGGWNLLGRALQFHPFETRGAKFAIGDTVRFVPSSDDATVEAPPRPPPIAPTRPHLEITKSAGLLLLVDGGRPGHMHEGVPPGGPLARALLTRANLRAGNAPSACAVELAGSMEVVARGGSIVIADDDERIVLDEGVRHAVSTSGRSRVRYLAVEGGIEAPLVLESRSTLLVAGIGGLLRKGDRLVPQDAGNAARTAPPTLPEGPALGAPVEIVPGPDSVPGWSVDALTSVDLRIAAASDRIGTRLEGLAVPTDRSAATRRSTPMVMGAIELTPSGPIVLGPDHPTTGGYPVVAVVRESSLDRLFARPIHAAVRLVGA